MVIDEIKLEIVFANDKDKIFAFVRLDGGELSRVDITAEVLAVAYLRSQKQRQKDAMMFVRAHAN